MSDKIRESKVSISLPQAFSMVGVYSRKKIFEQIRAVSLIVIYLIVFQIFILRIPVQNVWLISIGVGIVILGLAFFMEGLVLALMPLGELIGVRLPNKTNLAVILLFAFLLGVIATLAEPSVGILRQAAVYVKAWDAPLLFLLLNKYSYLLILAVGLGVGVSVVLGVLRFIYNWSLKPLIFIIMPVILLFSIFSLFDKNLNAITGLAWDCGGITTGPVTVPLVLALSIGICRALGKGSSLSGFGVVTLASALPVLTVILLGILLSFSTVKPSGEMEFLNKSNREAVLKLFNHPDELTAYVMNQVSYPGRIVYFGGEENLYMYLKKLRNDPAEQKKLWKDHPEASWNQWLNNKASDSEFAAVTGSTDREREEKNLFSNTLNNFTSVFIKNIKAALQAILPLTILLLLMLFLILREKFSEPDVVIFGLVLGIIGFGLFNIGIEFGLAKLGSQIGKQLPSAYQSIKQTDEKVEIPNFDDKIVQRKISSDGKIESFFYMDDAYKTRTIPFDPARYEPESKTYSFIPDVGPMFGQKFRILGYILVLIFGFFMGYGATLAEPALNALGIKVEEISVGTFKKSFLNHSVGIGVGIGLAVGIAKILWNIPLVYLLLPPYLILLVLTFFSSEEYVNIGWDSAGVTTGPVTVPLIIALGLGISSQIGVIDGFGVIACASVYPILTVLIVGIVMNARKRMVSG